MADRDDRRRLGCSTRTFAEEMRLLGVETRPHERASAQDLRDLILLVELYCHAWKAEGWVVLDPAQYESADRLVEGGLIERRSDNGLPVAKVTVEGARRVQIMACHLSSTHRGGLRFVEPTEVEAGG